ncbi:MAG TPA: ABC transporter permease [Nocardioidaceae bacterium]|nr:ABC transporter permease [Nocardioidaceae bacterium]
MSAMTEDRPTLDISHTLRVPMTRLVRVELRKMADTRAGRWLLIAIAAITAAIIVIFFFAAPDSEQTIFNFVGITATPQAFLLPVMGILLITSEWSQRTAMVTFTLSPVRGRVLVAKVVAALLLGFAAVAIALGVAALATVAGGASDPWQGFGWDAIGKFALLQTIGVLQGLAFGLLVMSSAAAIVLYFVLPNAFTILAELWSKLADIRPWVDLGFSSTPLFTPGDVTGEQWLNLASGAAIWVLLPCVLGTLRVLRSEVK